MWAWPHEWTAHELASSFESVSYTRQKNRELLYPQYSRGLHFSSYAVSFSPNTSFVSTSESSSNSKANKKGKKCGVRCLFSYFVSPRETWNAMTWDGLLDAMTWDESGYSAIVCWHYNIASWAPPLGLPRDSPPPSPESVRTDGLSYDDITKFSRIDWFTKFSKEWMHTLLLSISSKIFQTD